MKKLVLALTAVAALTTSASAADLGARPYAKAPVPYTPVASWTGFYIFGGGGGGLWNADSNVISSGIPAGTFSNGPAGTALTRDQRMGGGGGVGTGGGGYDMQVGGWGAGSFGEGEVGGLG